MTELGYRFLRACRRQPVDTTPVWIMRQAGRFLPEYRKIREEADFLTMCKTPELATEVTLLPVDILGVDAAILFSDILILVEAMGLPLKFYEKRGPVLDHTITDQSSVDKLGIPDPNDAVPFVMDAVRMIKRELNGRVPLIGFAGAPYTVASYMIEGRTSKQFAKIKALMFQEPKVMHALLDKVAKATTAYLNAQIEAGVEAIQLFDSWAGSLAPVDFSEFAVRYSRQVIEGLKRDDIPVIYFAQGNPAVLGRAKDVGSDVIGVDWRIEMK
ncbi:MAG TPA: uroporphyrinogen decarboxylase, partial [Actinobacteria bacterium]|nr:uroporphyrinogen decarboxylase [Actinomycetes bacterium]HEX21241.1 uroporphyrinogen decarboxylase [Actinomycetota bacterium]